MKENIENMVQKLSSKVPKQRTNHFIKYKKYIVDLFIRFMINTREKLSLIIIIIYIPYHSDKLYDFG